MTESGHNEPPNTGEAAEETIPNIVISEPGSPKEDSTQHNGDVATENHATSEETKTPEVHTIANHSPNGNATVDDGDNDSFCESNFDETRIIHDGDFTSQYSMNEFYPGHNAIIDDLPEPPDGGYGWVIVIAAFVSNFLVDGIANAFGAFMGSFEKEFGSSKAATSVIGSMLIGTYLLSGPFAGGLLNRFDARNVVIAGSILTGVAFILSTFSPNIFVFYLLYGFLGGIGFGLIYLPAIVVVGQYFESKRALATGIAVAGSGFGTFILPFVCQLGIEMYGWKPTLYFLAVLVFACIFCGLLYKPLPEPNFDIEGHQRDAEERQQALLAALSRAEEDHDDRPISAISTDDPESPSKRFTRASSSCTNDRDDGREPLLDSELMLRLRECEDDSDPEQGEHTPQRPQLSPITENKALSKSRAGSTHHGHAPVAAPPPVDRQGSRTRKHTMTSLGSELTIDFKSSRPNLSSQLSRISARSYAQSLSKISQGPMSLKASDSVLSVALSGVDPKEFNRPLSRQDIFLQGSIRNLKEFKEEGNDFKKYRESQISIPAAVVAQSMSNISQGGDIADMSSRLGGSRYSRMTVGIGADEEEYDFTDDSKCKWIPLAIRNTLSEMIDLSLLKQPVMLLLCLSNVLGMLGFYIPFVYIIDLAKDRQVSANQATLLVSIIGITNTFGRVIFGWAADRRWVTALAINNFSLIFCGALTVLAPLATSYSLLVVYASLFGFVVAAYICLTSIVLSDLLGVERLTNSFGLLVVSRGIAAFLGTPLAGLAYTATKSYGSCFIFSGIIIILAGLVSCIIPYIHRRERSQMKNEGEYNKEADAGSGKLSVLTERSEENMTEYQRTIQSLKQQRQLMKDVEEARRLMKEQRIEEAHEDNKSNHAHNA
uniref:MFS domain-containing protein n=1 Tax=Panagrellus redivivus TaxID=6233 RepID=A0A7E4UW14_PANRE